MTRSIVVNDKMQKGYRYDLVEPAGKNFDPEFTPQLTPKQMLQLGIFGGKYMNDGVREFPHSWFVNAKLSPERRDPRCNYFGGSTQASRSRFGRKRAGFIRTIHGVGSSGTAAITLRRRLPDEDQRQIRRWKAMRRHAEQVRKNCEQGNFDCHRK